MITLLSIRLRNFRKVREGVFTPLEDGVTGLSGANGAGKSSFLSATIWALYGVRPDDVATSGLRRQGSSFKDECSVSVVFKHAGQVVEVIRELRGKNNRTIMNIFVDGKEQTVTTPSAAEKWIADRLKIDAEAFTTAFVVRQKELDSLVDARPAERRATIERLSGIERMSAALKSARSEENEAKRQVQAMGGSEEEIALAAEVVSENQSLEESLIAEVEDAENKLTDSITAGKQAKSEYESAAKALDAYNKSTTAVQLKKSAVENARKLLDRTQQELASFEPVDNQSLSSAELEAQGRSQAAKRDEVQGLLEDAQASVIRHESRVSSLQDSLTSARMEVASHEKRISSLAIEDGREKSLMQRKESLESEVSTFVDSCSVLESEISSNTRQKSLLQRSIATLEEHSEGAECPTCHSHLEDPHVLISDMRAQIALLDDAEAILQEELKNDKTALADIRQEIAETNQALSNIAEERRVLETAQEALNASSERLTSLQQELDKVTNEKPADDLTETLRDELSSINSQLEETRTLFQSARLAERNEARRQQLAKDASDQEKEIVRLEEALAEEEAFLESLPPVSETDVQQKKQVVEDATAAYDHARQQLSDAKYRLGICRERLQTAERDYKAAVSLYDRKKAALVLYSQKTAVSDVLDEFRKDKIASIAPELSETATSLISAMTNGYYTEVLLDENFTPSVVDVEGNERPVSWLSGGEESVVALALRIAIGDLMTGGEGGLLWLDEVLTAQDASRRSSLLNTLRNLTGRQIVMINHTPDANDMVDKIITISETDDGSVIEEEVLSGEEIAHVAE